MLTSLALSHNPRLVYIHQSAIQQVPVLRSLNLSHNNLTILEDIRYVVSVSIILTVTDLLISPDPASPPSRGWRSPVTPCRVTVAPPGSSRPAPPRSHAAAGWSVTTSPTYFHCCPRNLTLKLVSGFKQEEWGLQGWSLEI